MSPTMIDTDDLCSTCGDVFGRNHVRIEDGDGGLKHVTGSPACRPASSTAMPLPWAERIESLERRVEALVLALAEERRRREELEAALTVDDSELAISFVPETHPEPTARPATTPQKRNVYALLHDGHLTHEEDGPIEVESLTVGEASALIGLGASRRDGGTFGFAPDEDDPLA